MGFNMIRKHVKVEPARWYYHCDKLGMLVWQDIPNATTNTQRNDWVETNFVREAHNIMNCLKNTLLLSLGWHLMKAGGNMTGKILKISVRLIHVWLSKKYRKE